MKRLLLPLILVILFTAVVFVSCSKEDPVPTTEPETAVESSSTTTTTAKPHIPTFKTAAPTSSTEFKGTPVIYSTTSTTTTTKATSTTKVTTTTTALTTASSTPTTTTNPGEKEFDEEDKEVGPVIPLNPAENSSITQILINTLG